MRPLEQNQDLRSRMNKLAASYGRKMGFRLPSTVCRVRNGEASRYPLSLSQGSCGTKNFRR